MDVSIIIVNYNTQELLRNCLNSIYKFSLEIIYEIIVVDNASIDNSIQMLEKEYPNVKVIKSDVNLGFGRANNLAINYSRGKYVFLLNSDTILLNNAVRIFFDFMELNNSKMDIGAIGAMLFDERMNYIHSYDNFPSIKNEIKNYLKSIHKRTFKRISKHPILPIEVDYVTGADLFIPLSVIKEIGAFDTDFFLYYEETDLQMRMKSLNFKRIIIDGPKIIHYVFGSDDLSNRYSYSKFALSHKSYFIYLRKHFKGLYYITYRLLLLLLRISIFLDNRFTMEEKINAYKLIIKGK